MATVEHEILGTGLWNYQMWTHVQPVRVYATASASPLDVYQRLVNANFNLNVRRAQLRPGLELPGPRRGRAPRPSGDFKQALEELQARIAAEPAARLEDLARDPRGQHQRLSGRPGVAWGRSSP